MATSPAFPGAEGYGAATFGARAGQKPTLHRVVNLDDSGKGSLRAALEAKGPRVVVFETGGTIEVKSSIRITSGQCTILGHTAPGAGICVTRPRGKPFTMIYVEASDVIMRYLRLRGRSHKGKESSSGDCLRIGSKGGKVERVIVDHCTFSWGTDETIDCYQPNDLVTIQWCLISDPIQFGSHGKQEKVPSDPKTDRRGHGYGIIFGPGAKRYTSAHNMYANVCHRCDRIKTRVSDVGEMINAYIYNGSQNGWPPCVVRTENGAKTQRVNIIGCVNRPGPNSGGDGPLVSLMVKSGGKPEVFFDCAHADIKGSGRVDKRHKVDHDFPVAVLPSADLFDEMADSIGCTVPRRDSYDELVISGVKHKTGHWILADEEEKGGLPKLDRGTLPGWAAMKDDELLKMQTSGLLFIEQVGEALIDEGYEPPIEPPPIEPPIEPPEPPVEPPTIPGDVVDDLLLMIAKFADDTEEALEAQTYVTNEEKSVRSVRREARDLAAVIAQEAEDIIERSEAE